jgi:hypothetical protein
MAFAPIERRSGKRAFFSSFGENLPNLNKLMYDFLCTLKVGRASKVLLAISVTISELMFMDVGNWSYNLQSYSGT